MWHLRGHFTHKDTGNMKKKYDLNFSFLSSVGLGVDREIGHRCSLVRFESCEM